MKKALPTLEQIKAVHQRMVLDLVNVQPMDANTAMIFGSEGLTTKELKEQGYRPVSRLGLMWIKDDRDDVSK